MFSTRIWLHTKNRSQGAKNLENRIFVFRAKYEIMLTLLISLHFFSRSVDLRLVKGLCNNYQEGGGVLK